MNITLNTLNIKGNEYVPVNERLRGFWNLYPNGRILTTLVSNENGVCVMRAEVYINKEDTIPTTTGTAYEKESSSFINKTSYIENCETSCIGRALGILGIGIEKSIASAEEVENAIENQNLIEEVKAKALEKAISNKGISNERVNEVLMSFGYERISDIIVGDYAKICNELAK